MTNPSLCDELHNIKHYKADKIKVHPVGKSHILVLSYKLLVSDTLKRLIIIHLKDSKIN